MTLAPVFETFKSDEQNKNLKPRKNMKKQNNTYEIEITELEGKTYYSTVVRGIEFLIYKQEIYEGAEWTVQSSRVSLGGLKKNPGTHRWFSSVEEIGKSIKSLKNIALMI